MEIIATIKWKGANIGIFRLTKKNKYMFWHCMRWIEIINYLDKYKYDSSNCYLNRRKEMGRLEHSIPSIDINYLDSDLESELTFKDLIIPSILPIVN